MKTIFSLHFSETPASDSFFPSSGNVFSMKSFIGNGKWKLVGQWKWIFCQQKLISFVQRFFLLVETVTAISESQFLRKGHILTNITDFLATGNQLLPFFSERSKLLPVEAVSSSTGPSPIIYSGQWRQAFCLLETLLCCCEFFSASGNNYSIEIG